MGSFLNRVAASRQSAADIRFISQRRSAETPLRRWSVALIAFVLAAPLLQAQVSGPRIAYACPAGGRQGTTFQVAVGGQYLNSAREAYVSGAGVEAAYVEYSRPMTQKEFNDARDKMRELTTKRTAAMRNGRRRGGGGMGGTNTWTAADEKLMADLRTKMFFNAPKRNQNPALAETVTLRITVATNAAPGEREIRLATPMGLSNPLRFWVGQLPEYTKREVKTVPDEATFQKKRYNTEQKAVDPTEANVTLPTIINGQVLQGGVDRYRFQARKGAQLVVAAMARELIPYLPDAVPGWFQAALALYDSKGKEIEHADHYQFHPDPVLHYEIPKDGEYIVEIRDSIYRGREDFVYRIAIGELPYVTSIFPLGGRADSQTVVEVKGWNLSCTSLTVTNGDPGVYSVSAPGEDRVSNPMPFAVDALPETLDKEPNNSIASAQPVTLPVIINGRIDRSGDWDVFKFDGKAGDTVVAEVYARRLDSPLDSVLKLTDAEGKQIAFNDDNEDKGAGLDTHFADSYIRATLSAEGTYYLHLGDTQRQGGEAYAYRLRISPPQPDFALRVVPSSVNLRGGSSAPLTVYALRRDGFTNEITLSLQGAPTGFKLTGAKVPVDADQVRLTLQAPPTPASAPVRLNIEGRAFTPGRPVVHAAVPAEDMMQAFLYRHLVPSKGLEVAVSGRFGNRVPLRVLSDTPVKIPVGGTARVRISAPGGGMANRYKLELNDPPEGIALGKVSPGRESTDIELQSDATKAKPGLKGNLIVNILPGGTVTATKNKNKGTQPRIVVGSLPAIPFEVVAAAKAN